jgi:hypothetical protein
MVMPKYGWMDKYPAKYLFLIHDKISAKVLPVGIKPYSKKGGSNG